MEPTGSGDGGQALLEPDLQGQAVILQVLERSKIGASTCTQGRDGAPETTGPTPQLTI